MNHVHNFHYHKLSPQKKTKPNSLKYLSLDFRKKNKIGDCFPIHKIRAFSCVLVCIGGFSVILLKIFLDSQSGG